LVATSIQTGGITQGPSLKVGRFRPGDFAVQLTAAIRLCRRSAMIAAHESLPERRSLRHGQDCSNTWCLRCALLRLQWSRRSSTATAIEIDRPGQDSYRLLEAGCQEVLLLGDGRWALMHELRGADEPALDYLLSRLQHCDIVLVEGFKRGDFPKLEVWRAEAGKPPLWPDWPGIVAMACEGQPPAMPPRVLPLADTMAITELVLASAAPVLNAGSET
jgi:molybdopterin-guanine dinucleotide biosynthesis protein B